jgi:acetyltransferase-like isoleucine patch superfamily enzyme
VAGSRLSSIATGLRELVAAPWLMLVRHLPGPLGHALRRRYWGRRLGSLGEGVRIDEGVHIVNPQHVFIGSGCWIATNVFIGAGAASTEGREVVVRENADFAGERGEVRIGDDTYIAPASLINGHGGVDIGENVSLGAAAKLYSSSHHYRAPGDPPGVPSVGAGMRREPKGDIGRQALSVGPVVIAAESFVGSHAIVMPGVTIGPRTWLGAGAVAHRSLEPGRVYRAPEAVPAEPSPSPSA